MYKTLIIGLGGQGCSADYPGSGNEYKIISYSNAFKKHQGFEVVGGCEPNKSKRLNAEKWWNIKTYETVGQCDEYFDVAVVATPDNCHYELLKQLSNYDLKLLVCEKPICDNLDQTREIVELYKAKGIPLMVNYTRRFLPYYEELKRRYKAGEFGRLVNYDALFNRGLLHTGSHLVDFLTWFSDFELPDGLFIKEVNVDYRVWQMQLFFEKYFWQEQRIGDMPVWDYYDKSHWYVVENAFNFLEGREPLKCTGEDALRSLEICFELMEGAK